MLMRNQISYEVLNGDTIDLGAVRLQWSFEKWSVKEYIEKGAIAVKHISLLNHRLTLGK